MIFISLILSGLIDLLPYNLSAAIFIFRLWLCKNFSTYTPYMLHNFSDRPQPKSEDFATKIIRQQV